MSHLRISQKVKVVLMWNLLTYYFYIKTNILADFQIQMIDMEITVTIWQLV